jgi:YfiH family protein
MIFPEIFDGLVMGFFTDRELGTNVRGLTGRRVYMPKQEHSDTVITIGKDLKPRAADAVITDRHDILIGVQSADCVPILLYDRGHQVVGAVHAGWRGTAKGILKKAIGKMVKKYHSEPGDILVALGPAIRWCCYEVDKDVVDAVSTSTGNGEYYKSKSKDGKFCLDLQTANKLQAIEMGIEERNISITDECTFCYPDRYYSHRKEPGEGRQGAFIGLP